MDVFKGGVLQVFLVVAGLASIASADLQMNAIGSDEFRCAATKNKIDDCQFKSYPHGGVVERAKKDNEWLRLDDTALSSGTCKVTLSKKFLPNVAYLIACRVRIQSNGSWVEKELFFNRNNELKFESGTPTLSAKMKASNGKLDLSVTATSTLTNCTFLIPGKATRIKGTVSGAMCEANFTSDVVPEVAVARLVTGQDADWALATQGSDDAYDTTDSEETTASVDTLTTGDSSDISFVTVSSKGIPGTFFTPVQELTSVPRSTGDFLKASCHAPKNTVVVWTLGDKILAEHDCQFIEWPWSFQEGNCVATLEHKVTWRDNGLHLGCRAKTTSPVIHMRSSQLMSEPLNITFAPVLTRFGVKWLVDNKLEVDLRVAASPEPMVKWAMGDLQGNSTPENMTGLADGEYFFSMDLDAINNTSDTLILSLTLANAVGSTRSQVRIGEAEDTRWLVVLSGVLGIICLILLIVVFVLVVPRYCQRKLGRNSDGLREGRGRCKVVESGIYAEVDEAIDYDDIYDDVNLPPAEPMRATKHLEAMQSMAQQNAYAH